MLKQLLHPARKLTPNLSKPAEFEHHRIHSLWSKLGVEVFLKPPQTNKKSENVHHGLLFQLQSSYFTICCPREPFFANFFSFCSNVWENPDLGSLSNLLAHRILRASALLTLCRSPQQLLRSQLHLFSGQA